MSAIRDVRDDYVLGGGQPQFPRPVVITQPGYLGHLSAREPPPEDGDGDIVVPILALGIDTDVLSSAMEYGPFIFLEDYSEFRLED